ncbi:amino acid transporter [Meira miltonrushii]|uniref:Amino acid transporter n=1 Tax=Meira miltonrushii TaxID=1280837 RepID=A0A316VAV6_9BASI|nr:amino acid transporter [Meira miltonrushii]PWN34642.1 amino acid transporter [Meira miltonrushii]
MSSKIDQENAIITEKDSTTDNVNVTELNDSTLSAQKEAIEDSTGANANLQHFSKLALIGLSFAALNTWAASSGTIFIGLAAGGPTSVLWGTIVGTCAALTIAISLAELCHLMPTKGAQYHWTFLLAPDRSNDKYRFLSYLSGWLGTAGWICLTSTAPLLSAQNILTNITLYHPIQTGMWSVFSIYMGFTLYAVIINIFGIKLLDKMNSAALFWSLIGCLVTFITLLASAGARGTLNDGKFIFTTFLNFTGWPNGVAWLIGLLQTQYALVGTDAVTHVIGEISNPRKNVPLAMILSCVIGGASAFVVLIAFLACVKDPLAVIMAQGGGVLLIMMDAMGSKGGAVALNSIFLINQIFTGPALVITSSRMLQAFAKDGCLPFNKYLGHISLHTETPIYAALANLVFLTIFGALLFGSTIAVQALQSASVVMLQLSYLPSIVLHLLSGRKALRQRGGEIAQRLKLGSRYGPIVNICAICYICLTTVFFLLPPVIPVKSGSMMNYAVVVLAFCVLLALINWFLYARRNFQEPIDLDRILSI